jgi:hypothetical protein
MAWNPGSEFFVPFLRGGLQASGVSVSDDGPWNGELESAVKKFQKNKGLTPDGIPGPNTWRALGPKLGPVTDLKAQEFIRGALDLRTKAYILAIHAHGSKSPEAKTWDAKHTVKLLTILEQWDIWLQRNGARALLWKYSWTDGKIPPGFPTYDDTPALPAGASPKDLKIRRPGAELGFLPLVVAGPPMLAGAGAAGGAVATAVVNTIGAAAAAAGAAWLGVTIGKWIQTARDDAPDIVETSNTTITIAPPVDGAPPPRSPKQPWSLRESLKKFAEWVAKAAAMLVAVLVAGFGIVATLVTAGAPLVTAAAGAAGGLFWLALAAAAAFLFGAKRKRGY